MAVALLVEALEVFLVDKVSSGIGCNLSAREARCLVPGKPGVEPAMGVRGGPSTAPATGEIICYCYYCICSDRLPVATDDDTGSTELIGEVLPGPFSMIFF